ncbi:MAG: hypothetical protein ACXABL_08115 [Candidatus Thorarchaeota archaeon]
MNSKMDTYLQATLLCNWVGPEIMELAEEICLDNVWRGLLVYTTLRSSSSLMRVKAEMPIKFIGKLQSQILINA